MKSLALFTLVVISSLQSQAKIFNCTETSNSKRIHSYDGNISLNVQENTLSFSTTRNQRITTGVAELDNQFKSSKQVRFIDIKGDICSSEGEGALFLDKSMLDGNPGTLVVSGFQSNESDSGPALLWFVQGVFYCK